MKIILILILRSINFALVAGLIGYAFITYILPTIRQDYDDQLKHHETLKNTHSILCEKKQNIEHSMKDDLLLQNRLKEKHAEWRHQLDARYKEKIASKNARIMELNEQMLIHAKQIEKERTIRLILPHAVSQARRLLHEKYKPHAQHEKYLDALCDRLNKGTHAQ